MIIPLRKWHVSPARRTADDTAFAVLAGTYCVAVIDDKEKADLIAEAHNSSVANLGEPDHYVVVANDTPMPHGGWLDYHSRLHPVPFNEDEESYGHHQSGPLVWEQYLGGPGSTLEGAMEAAERMRGFGRDGVRIARLVFLPEGA